MVRRRRGIAKPFLFIFFILCAFFGLCCFLLVSQYPWATSQVAEIGQTKKFFTTFWPKSLMQEALEEKKRLRRFAESEQRRRIGIQLRRMEFLNATITDITRDESVNIARDFQIDRSFRSFEWPSVFHPFSQLDSQRSQYIYFPHSGGFALREGLYLRSGDELRFSADLAREARNLVFYAFALSPGALQGSLGKFSFSNSFELSDVQKVKRVSHPVGDVTATQFAIRCVSGEFYIIFARVSRFEQTGRIPVQLSAGDQLWKASSEKDLARSDAQVADSRSSSPLFSDVIESETEGATESVSKSSVEGLMQNVKPPVLDPLLELSNPVVMAQKATSAEVVSPLDATSGVGDLQTVAVGYNVVLMKSSGPSELSASVNDNELENFFQDSVMLFSKEVESEKETEIVFEEIRQGLAQSLRKFGYHVVGFGSPSLFGLQSDFADRLEDVDSSQWLLREDSAIEIKNRGLDRSEKPAKGLDAIFDRKNVFEVNALDDLTWSRLAGHLELSGSIRGLSLLESYHETYVFKAGGGYYANLVTSVQDWSSDQWQNRFLQVIDLDSQLVPEIAFQNLVSGIFSDIKVILKPSAWESAAWSETISRSANQILESFRARKLTHRTLVALLDSKVNSEGREIVSLRLKIPALKKKEESTAAPIQKTAELRQSILGYVGVESSSNSEEVSKETKEFRLTVLSSPGDCPKIRWQSSVQLENLRWQNIKVEGQPLKGTIDIYPCSASSAATVTWLQQASTQVIAQSGLLPADRPVQSGSALMESSENGFSRDSFLFRETGSEILQLRSEQAHRSLVFYFGSKLYSPVEAKLLDLFGKGRGLFNQGEFLDDPAAILREKWMENQIDRKSGGVVLLEVRSVKNERLVPLN